MTTLTCDALPCFVDNYIWLLRADTGAWVVDPGDAAPVRDALSLHGLTLAGILLTHHHADHVGGVSALRAAWPAARVIGPAETAAWHRETVTPGHTLQLPGLGRVAVLDVAAHTRGHVAYHLVDHGRLFCGDSFFSAGCGRLFEGSAQNLLDSLAVIAALPDDTWCHPTHEYTLANLAFAAHVEPDNADIHTARVAARQRRDAGQPTLPVRLGDERRINPFLRHETTNLRNTLTRQAGRPLPAPVDRLAALRAWKDVYQA